MLLHGHPRTHATWHRVAPLLVDAGHAVVCPDLRGYGQSSKPATTPDHGPYSKRAMARDAVALMRTLGHDRFAIAGHDRGSYVAFRLAMDHPGVGDAPRRPGLRADRRGPGSRRRALRGRVVALVLPWADGQAGRACDLRRPGRLVPGHRGRDGGQAFADLREALRDPATVHAMCEDYRAGLTVDRAADDADRAAGRRVGCPTLVAWSAHDDLEDLYGDPLAVWREGWADDVRGARIDSGHHMAEEAPEQLAGVLGDFLAGER